MVRSFLLASEFKFSRADAEIEDPVAWPHVDGLDDTYVAGPKHCDLPNRPELQLDGVVADGFYIHKGLKRPPPLSSIFAACRLLIDWTERTRSMNGAG
jgi:hypothetical protein